MKSKINTLIGIYEMVGGIMGVYFLIVHGRVPKLENYQLLAVIITFFILTLYVLSSIGGFLLWRGKENGLVISIIVQIFQIPYILTASCIYSVASGAHILAGIGISTNIFKIILYGHVIPYFEIYFENVVKYNVIVVNIIPIIIILHIIRVQKIAKSSKLESKMKCTVGSAI